MSGPSDYSPITSNDDGRPDNAPQQRTMSAFQHLSLAKVTLGVLLPSFFAFVILDGIWIGVVAAKMYQRHLKPVLRQQVDPFAAVGSWLLIVLGCWLFAGSTGPSVRQAGAVAEVLGKGATYGFVVYGIYDLTNTATISGWSWGLALVDIAWGTFGSAVIALLQAWLATCWLSKH